MKEIADPTTYITTVRFDRKPVRESL